MDRTFYVLSICEKFLKFAKPECMEMKQALPMQLLKLPNKQQLLLTLFYQMSFAIQILLTETHTNQAKP